LRDKGFTGDIGFYSDVVRARYWNLNPLYTQWSWEDWTTNWSAVNYLWLNFSNSNTTEFYTQFGPFYEEQNFLNPSSYWSIIYPPNRTSDPTTWKRAAGYLNYHNFLIEVNRAWNDKPFGGSRKPIIMWQFLNYHRGGLNIPVEPFMAHAYAIFPYFSGGDGVALWQQTQAYLGTHKAINHHYIYGLYRLSKYNYMFDGNYETYALDDPVDLYLNVSTKPIWRGVVRQDLGKMLVAAHNPYSEKWENTTLNVSYLGVQLGNITLEGNEVFLGTFDI